MASLKCAGIAVLIAAAVIGAAQNAHYIKIHTGKYWNWYARSDQYDEHRDDIAAVFDYADEAFGDLVAAWGLSPAQQRYDLFVWDKTGGGFATGDIGEIHALTGQNSPGIACSYDAFSNVAHGIKGYWAPVLITHEMVNLFTGQIVGGGWPRDWWADDRSPFPLVTSVEIEFQIKPQIAAYHLEESWSDPLVKMFLKLKDRYGWEMFRKAFRMAIADGIDWNRFGGNPSALLTNYVAAYLEMGAGANLSTYMSRLVPNYDHTVVTQIIVARSTMVNQSKGSPAYNRDRGAYLSGRYGDVQ